MRLDGAGMGCALRQLDFLARAILEIVEVFVDHITHVMQLHPGAADLACARFGKQGRLADPCLKRD